MTMDQTITTAPDVVAYVKFPSHRARDYSLAVLKVDMALGHPFPKAYYISFVSPRAQLKHYGIYGVSAMQLRVLQNAKQERSHVRFTVLKPPYNDLMECWG